MNVVWKIFASMSFSGSLLILALLLGKRFLKDKISRQWQYYIWLVVVLRLLLPFAPQGNLMGKTYQAVDQAMTQAVSLQQEMPDVSGDGAVLDVVQTDNNYADRPAQDSTTVYALGDIAALFINHIWLVWLAVAFGMLLRKITIYQGFTRYIRAGCIPASDMELLDQLCAAAQCAGVYQPIELCVNPLVSSPMLLGFFHPCIVLPSADISGQDFTYIALHELTHYKRRDLCYKWLVQATVCLHWFNPFVYLMSREITRACEFSCDEAVLWKVGGGNAQDYGRTLLDAMAAVGKYKENPGAVTLSENKKLLKERLGAIMKYKRKSKAVWLLTGVLTLCVLFGAVFVGVYPAAATAGKSQAAGTKKSAKAGKDTQNKNGITEAERYYKAGSLPLFQIAFSRLNTEEQGKWLNKIYADQDIQFMGAALAVLEEDDALIQQLAKKAYERGDIAFFSNAMMHLSEDVLQEWLDRALKDDTWAFQSVLYQALDKDDEFEELEEKRQKKLAEAQVAEYKAAGVTFDGNDYYYKGKLVNIFLDERGKQSYYLDTNPDGTVNIKIKRNADGKITGVAYMTDEEVIKLFGEPFGDSKKDTDEKAKKESSSVDLKTVAAGKTVLLGEYTLSKGDRIWYDMTAGKGKGMEVYFLKDGQENPHYGLVHNLRQKGEPLRCALDITVEGQIKPGTYQLFLRASDGALKQVTGSIRCEYKVS